MENEETKRESTAARPDAAEAPAKGNVAALAPIGVFLVLYLGLGVLFEYVLGIPMGFYNIPIVVVFLVALLVACVQNRALPFDDKLAVMGRGIGDKTIVTMILIFMAAGIFVGTVGRDSAESVAYLMLSVMPVQFAVAVLFVVSCFVSLSMGTSVGTITLITPIAVSVSAASGFDLPLCVASVMGGAMFGDNLSFISDTTIAACQGQGCQMKDKFRENFKIALPAAIVALAIILVMSFSADVDGAVIHDYDLVQLIPYLIVLVGGIVGVNVFVVLLLGIASGSVIMVATGATAPTDLLANMGSGAAGMFETTMVAVLVSAICALIREHGGFVALLNGIKSLFKSRKGGQLGMGVLVMAMDVATANNTVAIVMANPIAAEMAETYGISKRKTASMLDIFSCVSQGIIPYGAQMLVAISAATELGFAVSAFEIIPFLFYPFLLLVSALVFIFLVPEKKAK
ncbi:MAG: Na+/H+ antiporter NhaC family protein [Eggerthellaceae bacterium]|nr:Na+/H+ antiporter NhaC family protein [Eggerthellaceae bacterium]